jgi:transcription factor C subunit 7
MNWTLNHTTGEYFANMPSPTGIPTDPALTAHGVKQSEELGQHMSTLVPVPDVLYCSPYYRCLQTLAPGARRLFAEGKGLAGGKVRVENGVR